MTVYYARHGETSWNKSHKIQGRIDVPLSEEGRMEAEGLFMKLKDVPIDLTFSSPLKRAIETAEIALGGRNVEILKDDRLLEIDYGDFEALSHNDDKILRQRGLFSCRYPNGESYLDAASRLYSFFDELKKKYLGKNILVVGHLGIARIVNSYFLNMSNEDFINFKIGNCELLSYEFRK